MNFKEALVNLTTSNSANDQDEMRQKWIHDINLEIHQFLQSSEKADFAQIIGAHPELGQLLVVLSQEELVMTSPEMFRVFMDNLLWFYRPTSTNSLELKASDWARKLLRNTVIFPKTDILKISKNINLGSSRLSTEQLLQTLQSNLRNHLQRGTHKEVQSFKLLAKDGSALLRNAHCLDTETLLTIISTLPSICCKSCPDEVRLFYWNLDRALTSGSSILPDIFHEKLGERYPIHVENELVKLVWQWVNKVENLDEEPISSWLIGAASRHKQLFHTAIHILITIFVKTGTNSTMAEFVHRFLQEIRSARTTDVSLQGPITANVLAQLYPAHLSSLIYLLEVDPSDLDDQLEEHHSLFLMRTLTNAIAKQSVGQTEVAFLLSQFPGWWNCIQRLSKHSDSLVRAQYAIFWNMLTHPCYIHPS